MNDLRERLERGLEQEPPHRPTADQLAAGHRALRRRRTTIGVGAVAVLAVAGGTSAALVSHGAESTHTDAPIATSPSVSASVKPSELPKRYTGLMPESVPSKPQSGAMPRNDHDFLSMCQSTVWKTPAANAKLFEDGTHLVTSAIGRDQAVAVIVSGDAKYVGVCRFTQRGKVIDGGFVPYESHVAVYRLGAYTARDDADRYGFGDVSSSSAPGRPTMISDFGHLPSSVAEVRIEFYDGQSERVRTADGWYSFVHEEAGDHAKKQYKRMSYYDAHGRLLAYEDHSETTRHHGAGYLDDYAPTMGGTKLLTPDYEAGATDGDPIGGGFSG